jgi:ArsR family transcriptional regulator, arsenate/arsenite/antimonite-responsive transcriptional repressor
MATNGECRGGGPAAPGAARLAESRRFAQRFHALGDEIRLEVLGLLRGGERCVCELTAHLELAQSRLSFHLKVLKDAGLISHRRQGRWSYYALDAAALRELEAFLGQVPPGRGSAGRQSRHFLLDAAAPCCQALEPAAVAVSRGRKEQR